MAPGTQARLICEWPDVNLGDVVTVIRHEPSRGYLVRANLEEIWVPAHVLSNHNRKPWSFRFRKSSFNNQVIAGGGNKKLGDSQEIANAGEVLFCPEFREKIKDVTEQCGSKVVFRCRVKQCGKNMKISWRKTEPDPCVMRNSGRFVLRHCDDGVAMLTINNARLSDSGTYMCIASNEIGSTQCSAVLTVIETLCPLKEPKIGILSSSSVLLEWESSASCSQFLVEYCKLGSGEWISPNNKTPINSLSYMVEHLIPGESYCFRLLCAQNKLVGLISVAITLPMADDLRWQQEQFKRRYMELEEIARGRFSVVRLAKDRGTGLEVALKQINRRKQPHQITQAEYTLLAGMQHHNIVRSMALFDNAPIPGTDTIVLELVRGPLLFEYICQREIYSESEVKSYAIQLVSALAWLHQKDLAHLDVKPENVMVDVANQVPVLKLVDFGDCVNTTKNVILPPACLEFASPELVLGQPVGKHTDYWAVGVFLYVLLSGVSPFLDDSMEETTANILKCDYCFPEEYFKEISVESKDLISKLLVLSPLLRINIEQCLESDWIKNDTTAIIPSSRLKTFMQRRHPMNLPSTPTTPQFVSIDQV